jgi:acyl-CoA oxidase
VMSLLERERAWFIEHGRISSATARTIPAAVDALCATLRPHARALVDGFGIPQGWLAVAMS